MNRKNNLPVRSKIINAHLVRKDNKKCHNIFFSSYLTGESKIIAYDTHYSKKGKYVTKLQSRLTNKMKRSLKLCSNAIFAEK